MNHVIKRLIIEIEAKDKDVYAGLREGINNFVERDLPALVEGICDRLVPSDMIFELESIFIDGLGLEIGWLGDLDELTQQFSGIFQRKIESEVARVMADPQKRGMTPLVDIKLRAIYDFLKNGYFDWWWIPMRDHRSMEMLYVAILKSHASRMKDIWHLLENDRRAVERFCQNFSKSTINKTLELLAGTGASTLKNISRDLAAAFEIGELSRSFSKHTYTRAIEEAGMLCSFDLNRGASKKEILVLFIKKLSDCLHLDYLELLSLLGDSDGAQQRPSHFMKSKKKHDAPRPMQLLQEEVYEVERRRVLLQNFFDPEAALSDSRREAELSKIFSNKKLSHGVATLLPTVLAQSSASLNLLQRQIAPLILEHGIVSQHEFLSYEKIFRKALGKKISSPNTDGIVYASMLKASAEAKSAKDLFYLSLLHLAKYSGQTVKNILREIIEMVSLMPFDDTLSLKKTLGELEMLEAQDMKDVRDLGWQLLDGLSTPPSMGKGDAEFFLLKEKKSSQSTASDTIAQLNLWPHIGEDARRTGALDLLTTPDGMRGVVEFFSNEELEILFSPLGVVVVEVVRLSKIFYSLLKKIFSAIREQRLAEIWCGVVYGENEKFFETQNIDVKGWMLSSLERLATSLKISQRDLSTKLGASLPKIYLQPLGGGQGVSKSNPDEVRYAAKVREIIYALEAKGRSRVVVENFYGPQSAAPPISALEKIDMRQIPPPESGNFSHREIENLFLPSEKNLAEVLHWSREFYPILEKVLGLSHPYKFKTLWMLMTYRHNSSKDVPMNLLSWLASSIEGVATALNVDGASLQRTILHEAKSNPAFRDFFYLVEKSQRSESSSPRSNEMNRTTGDFLFLKKFLVHRDAQSALSNVEKKKILHEIKILLSEDVHGLGALLRAYSSNLDLAIRKVIAHLGVEVVYGFIEKLNGAAHAWLMERVRLITPKSGEDGMGKIFSIVSSVARYAMDHSFFDEKIFLKSLKKLHSNNRSLPGSSDVRVPTRDDASSITKGPDDAQSLATTETMFYIENGAVVMLWPFLEEFFNDLGLMKDSRFLDETSRANAMHAMCYLGCNRLNNSEWKLPLLKILSGVRLEQPIRRTYHLHSGALPEELCGILDLDDLALMENFKSADTNKRAIYEEVKWITERCDNFLNAAIQKWDSLTSLKRHEVFQSGISLQQFKDYFLQRSCAMRRVTNAENSFTHITIPRYEYDSTSLLPPWQLDNIRLPWMAEDIIVHWM